MQKGWKNPRLWCIVRSSMRKKSFQKAFQARSREMIRLLGHLPLSDVNRHALEAAARKAAMDALLGANFLLVHTCHDISVLASVASGPGIPEGAARLRQLRAALRRAQRAAGLSEGEEGRQAGDEGPGYPGCPCSRTTLVRGRLVLPAAALERARSQGGGLRLLRFRPSDLKKSPGELSESLSALAVQGALLGLYAVTGNRQGSPAREFALLAQDRARAEDSGADGQDPLSVLPVAGRIRTLLAAGEEAVPDLSGLEVTGTLPSSAAAAGPGKTVPRGAAKLPRRGAAKRALRAGADPDSEFRNATTLYADLPGILPACRGLDARRAVDFLNQVLSRFSRCVEGADGVVDAFVGSSLYGFWGAPASTGRDAAAAAQAALAMRRILRLINRGRRATGRLPLRLACGLDSSPVLAGRVGSPDRLSYTVAGEAPRRACRIACLNEALGTDILVSDYTLRLMGDAFLALPVDVVRTEEWVQPFRVYALLGKIGDPGTPRDLQGLRELLGTA